MDAKSLSGTGSRKAGKMEEHVISEARQIAQRDAERRFRAVFNQQFQFIAILSPEGIVLEINDLPLKSTGILREQVIGKLFWETPFWAHLPAMRESWPRRLAEAANAEGPVLSEDKFETAAGIVRVADAAVTAVRDAHGRIDFFIVQAADITDRKSAEEKRERETRRLQLLADTAHHLLSSKTPEQIVREMFRQLAPEFALDCYFNFILDEQRNVLVLDSFAGIAKDRAQEVSTFPLAASGAGEPDRRSSRISNVRQSDYPNSQFLHRIGIRAFACHPLLVGERLLGTLSFGSRTRDAFNDDEVNYLRTICDFVALAQERALHERLLEKRVADRTAELRDTIGQLETFSYSITHDMRGPLRAMASFAHLLELEYGERLDEDARRYIHRIMDAAARMDSLIQDVLQYSKLSRESLALEPVNLFDAINDVVTQYGDIAQHAEHIHICPRCKTAVVHANRAALTQAISNLVTNALKFVPKDRTPKVELNCDELNGHVRLTVIDNGIGIAPQHQQQIFGIFERLHGPEYAGTGIGLSIVKKAVERMGGTVGVQSELGHGARFWIQFPKPTPAPAAPTRVDAPDRLS